MFSVWYMSVCVCVGSVGVCICCNEFILIRICKIHKTTVSCPNKAYSFMFNLSDHKLNIQTQRIYQQLIIVKPHRFLFWTTWSPYPHYISLIISREKKVSLALRHSLIETVKPRSSLALKWHRWEEMECAAWPSSYRTSGIVSIPKRRPSGRSSSGLFGSQNEYN